MKLHVFTDDTDTCIAADLDGVREVMTEYGYPEVDMFGWYRVGNKEPITIHCDAHGNPATPGDPGVAPITKTAAEWCSRGPGFLCTTEY